MDANGFHKEGMMTTRRFFLAILALGLGLVACNSRVEMTTSTPSIAPQLPAIATTEPTPLNLPNIKSAANETLTFGEALDTEETDALIKEIISDGLYRLDANQQPEPVELTNGELTLLGGRKIEGDTIQRVVASLVGRGGSEHIAAQLKDAEGTRRWIMLTYREHLVNPDGDTYFNGFGYYYFDNIAKADAFLPLLSAETDADGNFTGTNWFFDQETGLFYPFENLAPKGKGLLSLIPPEEKLVSGLAIIKGQDNWNFTWDKEDNLVLVDAQNTTVRVWDEASNAWVEPLPAPPEMHTSAVGYIDQSISTVHGLHSQAAVSTEVRIVTDPSMDMYGTEIKLNREIYNGKRLGMSADERLGTAKLYYYYLGWQQDSASRKDTTFDQYLQDLQDGKDMNFWVIGRVEGKGDDLTRIKVDPTKPLELVPMSVPNEGPNGEPYVKLFQYNYERAGIYQLTDGSLRILISDGINISDEKTISNWLNFMIQDALSTLLLSDSQQQNGGLSEGYHWKAASGKYGVLGAVLSQTDIWGFPLFTVK